jgi:hypothetical protein
MSHIDLMEQNAALKALCLTMAHKLADAVEVIMRHAEPLDREKIKRMANDTVSILPDLRPNG